MPVRSIRPRHLTAMLDDLHRRRPEPAPRGGGERRAARRVRVRRGAPARRREPDGRSGAAVDAARRPTPTYTMLALGARMAFWTTWLVVIGFLALLAAPARRARVTPWQQRLGATAAGTVPGILVRLNGGAIAYPLQLVAYGAAVVTAAFILAWACEAAQVDVARGAVVAAVAFVAILPGVHRRGALRVHRQGGLRDREPDRREPAAARRLRRAAGRGGGAAAPAGALARRRARSCWRPPSASSSRSSRSPPCGRCAARSPAG